MLRARCKREAVTAVVTVRWAGAEEAPGRGHPLLGKGWLSNAGTQAVGANQEARGLFLTPWPSHTHSRALCPDTPAWQDVGKVLGYVNEWARPFCPETLNTARASGSPSSGLPAPPPPGAALHPGPSLPHPWQHPRELPPPHPLIPGPGLASWEGIQSTRWGSSGRAATGARPRQHPGPPPCTGASALRALLPAPHFPQTPWQDD